MPLRLEGEARPGIPVRHMRDGQMARIVAWSNHPHENLGRLVQRYEGSLVVIGERSGVSFDTAFHGKGVSDDCRVEIIPNGTQFEVFDNE